jgi:hypothetical protein
MALNQIIALMIWSGLCVGVLVGVTLAAFWRGTDFKDIFQSLSNHEKRIKIIESKIDNHDS